MNYHSQIKQSEQIISKLHKRLHDTFKLRRKSKENEEEWEHACAEFRITYDKLYFLNGIEDYRKELREGNKEALEYAICFLEVRPYFHRSGYMFNDLLRVLKNCDLSQTQKSRFEDIKIRYTEYKENRKKR